MSSRRRSAALAMAGVARDAFSRLQRRGDGDPGDDESLLVWTTEDQEDRVQTQRRILDVAARSRALTWNSCRLGEAQLPTILTSPRRQRMSYRTCSQR